MVRKVAVLLVLSKVVCTLFGSILIKGSQIGCVRGSLHFRGRARSGFGNRDGLAQYGHVSSLKESGYIDSFRMTGLLAL